MAGADHGVVWDRPELRALCPPGTEVFDAPNPQLGADGSRFGWRGIEVRLGVPGAHNARNAAGALTAVALTGADPARAAESLVDFTGARRRMECLGRTRSGAVVYDDYAHHPTEVAAVIAAARSMGPRRVVAVFPASPVLTHARARGRLRAGLGGRRRRRGRRDLPSMRAR